MVNNKELTAFLEARTCLPNPDSTDTDTVVVSVGNSHLKAIEDQHLPMELQENTFTFKKCQSYGRSTNYQWVCTDANLQQVIWDNLLHSTVILRHFSDEQVG